MKVRTLLLGFAIASILVGISSRYIASADENNKSINLSRLLIARVYATSERKGSHGIQKVFDGSTATSWVSSDHDPWVRVRFTKLVTVQSVAIHAAVESAPSTPPEYFEVHVRHPGEKQFITYPLTKATNPTSSFALPKPVEDVRDVWITFPSRGPIHIDELAIMGDPPEGTKLAEVVPAIDPSGQTFVRELKRIEKREIREEKKLLKNL